MRQTADPTRAGIGPDMGNAVPQRNYGLRTMSTIAVSDDEIVHHKIATPSYIRDERHTVALTDIGANMATTCARDHLNVNLT